MSHSAGVQLLKWFSTISFYYLCNSIFMPISLGNFCTQIHLQKHFPVAGCRNSQFIYSLILILFWATFQSVSSDACSSINMLLLHMYMCTYSTHMNAWQIHQYTPHSYHHTHTHTHTYYKLIKETFEVTFQNLCSPGLSTSAAAAHPSYDCG